MTRVAIEELNENSLSCFHEEGRIILTVRGHDVAVIVPADLLEAIEDYFDLQAAERLLAEAKEEYFENWEDVKRRLDC